VLDEREEPRQVLVEVVMANAEFDEAWAHSTESRREVPRARRFVVLERGPRPARRVKKSRCDGEPERTEGSNNRRCPGDGFGVLKFRFAVTRPGNSVARSPLNVSTSTQDR